jgi:hypothetical protein
MDGKAWQRLCVQVLHNEHAEDLIPVPDKTRGDAGLEAYTLTGLAYQCYSPEEPLSAEQRYAKHRDKMTEDVGKFINNSVKLEPMLGTVRVRRWILLVPVADSRQINVHATKQTARVREAAPTYADAEIFVIVQTLDHYQASVDAIVNSRLSRLFLPALESPDYSSVNSSQIDVMHTKLTKVPRLREQERRRRYVQSLLTSNLSGQEHRDYIRDHYPELEDELEHLLRDLEERLDSEFSLSEDTPERMLLRVKADAEKRVRRALPTVRDGDARVIADGQVADWLMRCPLDFDESVATDAA